jgi:hypothetical protein
MSLALSLLLAPLALDGESVNNNNTAIAAVSLVSIVGGFLALGALWYFVFRPKAWDKDKDDPPPPPRG